MTPATISANSRAVTGNEAVEHDVLVFQSLGFMDREKQRRGKVLTRCQLVFVAHDQHGELGGLANLLVQFALGWRPCPAAALTLPGSPPTAWTRKLLSRSMEPKRCCLILSSVLATRVASSPLRKLVVQHAQFLPLRQLRVVPEEALDLAPGEEVGMDNLVGVAAEQKAIRHS